MKQSLSIACLTLFVLVLLDLGVASALAWADGSGKFDSLVRYFEYGRSVPGKLERWEEQPDVSDNLYNVAWRSGAIVASREGFEEEQNTADPVIRSYGMSFVNNILRNAEAADPDLTIDIHSGPAAPPNFTYSMFLDDAANRRTNDIVVFGILSSSVPAMAAMSNRTWSFEQPAPFTYPVFHPEGDDLRRVEPLVNGAAVQRSLRDLPDVKARWTQQLSDEDMFYSSIMFGATWLDVSPLARLVRRSLAKGQVAQTEVDILSGSYPYADVLQVMIATFAETARRDGQIPIIVLVQSRDATDANVLAIAKPILERDDIAYFATAEHFDPRNLSGFLADGHYTPEIDRSFGEAFADLVEPLMAPR